MFRRADVLHAAALGAGLAISSGMCFATNGGGQAPAATAGTAARQIGTVKSLAGNSLTLATDAGQQILVNVAEQARILQLTPGSTSLKEAQTIALTGIEAGDRVLVTGKAGADGNSFEASRVILMKSSDIAQKHAAEEADWQKRGMGGIVTAVDAATGTLTVAEGAKKVAVNTSSKTEFRRYAGDSVKYEDAVRGSFAQVHAGDQVRVRGEKSADGTSIAADEVISGSFKHLSGVIATITPGNETLTLKDLATKKMMTVKVMANSMVRVLPPGDAARFAARAKNSGAAGGESHAGPERSGQAAGEGEAAGARSAGMDLSQLVSRLPNQALADLKVGDAVMIVASQSDPGSSGETAVTVLAGVEPILAATPNGAQGMTLSPWNIGGGAGDASAQ